MFTLDASGKSITRSARSLNNKSNPKNKYC